MNLKFLENVRILSGNRDNIIYNKFLQGHKLPEPLYFFEGKFGAELLNFSQLLQQPDVDQSLQETFDEDIYSEKSINIIAKPCFPILKNNRQTAIS